MRRLVLLFTGFLLLGGAASESLLPVASIAQNTIVASNHLQSYSHVQGIVIRNTEYGQNKIPDSGFRIPDSETQRIDKFGETNEPEIHSAPQKPQKRSVHLALKAIAAKKRREAANNQAQDITSLLAVVDQEDIRERHRILANEVLLALPDECVPSLKNFYVRYDNPSRRGLAGKSSIILDGSVPDDEFRALLIHEFGHITDLGCMVGHDKSNPSLFKDGAETVYSDDPSVSFYSISWLSSTRKRPQSKPDDFVSGYAAWDPFEDFAESYAYFVLQNDAFRQRARENPVLAAKYRWLASNIFQGRQPSIATGEHEWEGEVPWDVTKLAFRWHPAQNLASAQ